MSNVLSKEQVERRAPVQGYAAGIPWEMHLRAYSAYVNRHGTQQALIEGNCRGGFSTAELDDFVPGWRNELSVILRRDKEIEALRAEVARLKVQQMQFRGWLDHAGSLIGGEEASYVIGVVDKLGFASPFDSTENAALLRDTDRPAGEIK